MHTDTGTPAEVFVVRAFVSVLETPPTAYVINQNGFEVRIAGFDIADQLLQPFAVLEVEPALTFVRISPDDRHFVLIGVLPDGVALVLSGVALMIRGHTHVLRDSSCAV